MIERNFEKKKSTVESIRTKETVAADDLLIALMDSNHCQKKTTMSSSNLSAVHRADDGLDQSVNLKECRSTLLLLLSSRLACPFIATDGFAARCRPSVVANLYLLPVACTQNRINRHKQFKRKAGRANQRQAVRVISLSISFSSASKIAKVARG
jgi:hypothetical protein